LLIIYLVLYVLFSKKFSPAQSEKFPNEARTKANNHHADVHFQSIIKEIFRANGQRTNITDLENINLLLE